MYFPLSQITTNLSTKGGELIVQSTGEEYVGNYFKTSKGKFYSGKSPNDGVNLLLVESNNANTTNQEDVEAGTIGSYNADASITLLPSNYLNANPSSTPKATPPPKSSITRPTQTQYENTKYKRYFLKKANNYIYQEINLKTYNLYINQDPSVQFSLYNALSIDWYLSGNLLDTYKRNIDIVTLAEEQNKWFGFLQSFKDRFARYYKLDPNATFYTSGGELKIKDTNKEYVGFYHVHPSRGVLMEGKVHVNTPHAVLVLVKEGEKLVKIQRIDGEVGTSRRRNIPRGGY